MRQQSEPFAEEGIDLGSVQAIAEALGGFEVGTAKQAVVQGFKRDVAFGQLAFEVFMSVEAELGEVGKVGAELDEERSEILIDAVEVIGVDHGRGVSDPRDGASIREMLADGARDANLFLGDANEDHPLGLFEATEMLLENVVFALALLKANQRDIEVVDEVPNTDDECVGDIRGLFGGGEAVAQVVAEEAGHALLAGELRACLKKAFEWQNHASRRS